MKNNSERLSDILSWLDSISYIKTEKIPEVDLYMDQVTSFMEEHLKKTKRSPEDKALTKTMINNYAKNRLLPPRSAKNTARSIFSCCCLSTTTKTCFPSETLNSSSVRSLNSISICGQRTEPQRHLRGSVFPRSPSDGSPERGYPCKIRRQPSDFHGHRQRGSGVSAAVCLYQRTFLRCLSKKAHDRDAD